MDQIDYHINTDITPPKKVEIKPHFICDFYLGFFPKPQKVNISGKGWSKSPFSQILVLKSQLFLQECEY